MPTEYNKNIFQLAGISSLGTICRVQWALTFRFDLCIYLCICLMSFFDFYFIFLLENFSIEYTKRKAVGKQTSLQY